MNKILSALQRRSPRASRASPPAMAMQALLSDLRSDDWEPLQTPVRWCNPCFFSSALTLLSVVAACRRGAFVFAAGPCLVLASSLIYWRDPVKQSSRRAVDLAVVRMGLAWQVLLAARFCSSGWMPRLLSGYAVGALCYAVGRVLTVRKHRWAGAYVHCGVHFFANLGNLLILPFVRLGA